MNSDPTRCPLCGQPNECQLAKGDCNASCWCMSENFPPEVLTRVPEEARRSACICRRCLLDATAAQAP